MKIVPSKGGSTQRLILTGMITSRTVLAAVASRWTADGLFPDKFGNIIGKWCVDYYEKYTKAPGMSIQMEYDKWAAKTKDAEVETVGKFLRKLSEDYESRKKSINTAYVIDEAQTLFKRAQLKFLKEALDEDLETDDIKEALKRIEEFNPITINTEAGIDVFGNTAEIAEAMDNPDQDILLKYPGAAGKFFEDTFSRGHLVSYMGMEKIGKSQMLIDVAVRGVMQGNKVAFFGVGDMTRRQMMRRFMARVAGRPYKPGVHTYPVSLEPGSPPHAILEKKEYTEYLSSKKSNKASMDFLHKNGIKKNALKLYDYANDTMNIDGIKAVLQTEKRYGWYPDIVVIDYSDILAPKDGRMESRDQINSTWKGMRSLAHNMCVVTATQIKAAGYDAEVLGMKDFADDKRKLAHANVIIGINSNENEKDNCMRRLNLVVARESEFVSTKVVYCAGSLGISNPIMFSSF